MGGQNCGTRVMHHATADNNAFAASAHYVRAGNL